MKKIWLTYAWSDNKEQDVDFIAQEIKNYGLEVKLDRWQIQAGKRLWEQIDNFITNPDESDAWIIYATENSLGSEPCKEEFAYALDRALGNRGKTFPVIALFPSKVETSLIPTSLKTRLHLSTSDSDWKERIKAAAENRNLNISQNLLAPYIFKVHDVNEGDKNKVIEIRPRAGSWTPFFAAIPLNEKDSVSPTFMNGPKDRVTSSGALWNTGQGASNDNKWWAFSADNEASPYRSYYIHCKKLPSVLTFGVNGTQPQYQVKLTG
jgi:hypothetical protein